MLKDHRDVPNLADRPDLNVTDILRWADAHHRRTGSWPTKDSGPVQESEGESWLAIDHALRDRLRRLPGGSSLSQLLTEQRGHRNVQQLPPLTIEQILAWADNHFKATGRWPQSDSGVVPDSGGENWSAIDMALRVSARHLPGGSSLARLLAAHRCVRNRKGLPNLTVDMILNWADAHRSRTGAWPRARSGPIREAPGETWLAVDMALRKGLRGFTPPGSSLAKLLAKPAGGTA